MTKLKLTAKALRKIGFPDSPLTSQMLALVHKKYRFHPEREIMKLLEVFIADPNAFLTDPLLGAMAEKFVPLSKEQEVASETSENRQGIQFAVFGKELIEPAAFH